jgi:hypothetical protein
MDNEIWKPIEGYNEMYEISNFGNLRSFWNNRHNRLETPVMLSQTKTKKGHHYYDFSREAVKKKMYIHRLVATAFLEKPEGYDIVDHIDRNPSNNRVDNLRWCNLSINSRNSKLSTRNTSGEKNISWSVYHQAWQIQIVVEGKRYNKRQKTLEDAVKLRDQILTSIYGESKSV